MIRALKSTFVVILIMVSLTLFSVMVSAETEGIFTYTITDGYATITSVDTATSGDVVIPETLGGYPVKKIDDTAFSWTKITTVTIPDSVVSIGWQSFYQCTSLKSVKIGSGLESIGDYAFQHTYRMTEYVVSEDNPNFSSDEFGVLFDKAKTIILAYPIGHSRTAYEIPNTVKEIGLWSFGYCDLTDVTIPGNVETVGEYAFYNSPTIISLTIDSGVKEIKYNSFGACFGLTNVLLSDSVTTIEDNAFGDCRNLTNLLYTGTEEMFTTINIGEGNDYLNNATKEFNFSSPNAYQNISIEYINDILYLTGTGDIQETEPESYHPWDEYAETATAIIISGDIEKIGAYSFCDFNNISTIIINTPSITVENNSFTDCVNLKNVFVFGSSNFSADAFSNCFEPISIFNNSEAEHTIVASANKINSLPFSYENNAISISGSLFTNAYNFFDIVAAFCNQYDNVSLVKFDKFTCEDITFYRYDEANYSYVPIEGNTLENASFSVFLDSYETGKVEITFNQLSDGISDGSITDFYLVATNEKNDDVLDTEIEVKDEEEENFFERALKWIVSLLNKLFKLFSRL